VPGTNGSAGQSGGDGHCDFDNEKLLVKTSINIMVLIKPIKYD
jgi:hypothetical protein